MKLSAHWIDVSATVRGWMWAAVFGIVALMLLGVGGVYARWYLPFYCSLWLLLAVLAWLLPRTSDGHLPFAAMDAWLFLVLVIPWVQWGSHLTVDASDTQVGILHMSAAAAVFWLIRQSVPSRRALNRAAAGLGAAAGLLGLEAILQSLLTPNAIFGLLPSPVEGIQPMGSFVDRNDFTACMELLLPFALLKAWQQRGNWRALWWILVVAVVMAAVVMSGSRGGLLAMLAEILVFGAWAWRQSAPADRQQLRWRFIGASALAGAVIVAAGFRQIDAKLQAGGLSDPARWNYVLSALQMGRERPWTGFGLGTFQRVYPRFARFDPGLLLDYAHCDYAQWFAETGVPGVFAALGVLVSFLPMVRRGLAQEPELASVCVLGLCTFAIHDSIEFFFHIPGLLLLFALVAGILGACAQPRRRRRTESNIAASATAMGADRW